MADGPPPSPQFWGSRTTQSPPELGDLGGAKDSNEASPDLCVHRREGFRVRADSRQNQRIFDLLMIEVGFRLSTEPTARGDRTSAERDGQKLVVEVKHNHRNIVPPAPLFGSIH
jgi:hypothetical protein